HGIVPTSIKKDVPLLDYAEAYVEPEQLALAAELPADYGKDEATEQLIHRLEIEMKAAAKELEFERAAVLRNRIRALKLRELELKPGG
ncbi:MAG TPA: UvrB/UvrC motif-containing protein, partial [Nitrospira sp.]|nr:UvrB/UvrC motif-containing protein [Nitrospira sp.]